jgi:hypothetical protein
MDRRRLGFVAPTSAAIGPRDEAKLLNPIVRRLVYDRCRRRQQRMVAALALSYRVLIVEDTDLGVDEPAKLVLRERNFRYACSTARTFTAPI